MQVVPEGATAGGDTPAYKEEYTSLAQSSMEPEHMISSEEDEETDDSDYEKQQVSTTLTSLSVAMFDFVPSPQGVTETSTSVTISPEKITFGVKLLSREWILRRI